MADYERAVNALSLMVAANSRQQLLLASTDMDVLVQMFVLPTLLGDASTTLPPDPDQKRKLLQLLCSAYAHAIDLVTGPLPDDFTEDFVLRLTSLVLTSVCVMLKEGTNSLTQRAGPKQLSKAQLVSSTGLMTALTAACAEFAKQLLKHTANHDMVYSVAVSTLHTVTVLMLQWPGKRVLGRVFPPLLLPATRLALVMAKLPNPADAASRSCGAKQQAREGFGVLQMDVEHLIFAGNLMDALQADILHLKEPDFLQHVSAAQHILESRDVQELCVILFATQVKKFHADQQSSHEASTHADRQRSCGRAGAGLSHQEQQDSAVAASHDKVLDLLQCKNSRLPHGNLVEVHAINCSANAVYELLTYRMRSPDCVRSRDQRPPLPLPTWEAVLLLYVELQLLAPTAETVMVAQESIHFMSTLPVTELAVWLGEIAAARGLLSAAVAEGMLLLVPAAVKVARQEANVSGDQAEKILESYGLSLWSVLAITCDSRIVDIVQKQPETAAAAFEMAVRGVPIDTWIKIGFLNKYLASMRTLLKACLATVLHEHSSTTNQPEQQIQHDPVRRPLLQLALSCLKSLRKVLQIPSLEMDDMLQALACATDCVVLAAGCKPLSASREQWQELINDWHKRAATAAEGLPHTSHTAAATTPPLTFGASSSSSSWLLPLVTAARGLDIVGRCFEKMLQTCKASKCCPGPKVAADLQVHLYACCGYTEWVSLQLFTVEMPTLDIITRITLVDVCKEILGAILRQRSQVLSTDDIDLLRRCQRISTPEAIAAELGPKLQSLGAKLCSALPIPSCCSNLECLNTANYTEQQLVGGKGSLCGGCRTARYCSAACHREHWSKHRAVCNAIKRTKQHRNASGSAQPSS